MTSPLDPGSRLARARSFSAVSADYADARPSYPDAAVASALAGVAAGSTVLDLAAGTGKLTAVLARLGYAVLAVEPSVEMLAQLVASVSGVPAVAGTAEAIPLADGVADAVTVAQAYHWFDVDRAHDELSRVLRPGGVLLLLWNERDDVPWVRAVWEHVADRTGTEVLPDDWQERLSSHPAFGPVEELTFQHSQPLTRSGVLSLVRSRSNIAVLDAQSREAVLARVAATLDEHPDTRGHDELSLPYTLRIFRTTRSSAP